MTPQANDLRSEPKFGDWLRGIHASETNPHRDGMYVRTIRRAGRMNPGKYYELTDGKGEFWQYPATSTTRLTALLAEHGGEAVGYIDGSRVHELKDGRLNLAMWAEPSHLSQTPVYLTPPPQPRGDMVLDVIWRIDNEAEQFIPAEGMKYLRYLRDLLAAAPGEGSGQ